MPFQKGVAANPTGRNGWTRLRERARDRLEPRIPELVDRLIEKGLQGSEIDADVQALIAALRPALHVTQNELSADEDTVSNLAEVMRKSRDSS